jgi:hypothetical protein
MDQVKRPLLLDQLSREDDRGVGWVKPERGKPFRAGRPGGLRHGLEPVIVDAVRCEVMGYPPVAPVEGGIALPYRQCAARGPDDRPGH